jgi:hypothetical protein
MIGLAAVAALTALHVVVLLALPAAGVPDWIFASHLAAKVLAVVGTAAAFAVLKRDDYMRRFWGPLSGSYLLLTLAVDAFSSALAGGSAAGTVWVSAALFLGGNLLSVTASVVLARTYLRAGLEGATGRSGAGGFAISAAVALVISGVSMLHEVQRALAGGGVEAWSSVGGYACDVLTFVLLAPVVIFAFRLGRSRLAAPWWTFTASVLLWLLYATTERLPGPPPLALSEALRTGATLLAGLAGWYQRALVIEARTRLAQVRSAAVSGA